MTWGQRFFSVQSPQTSLTKERLPILLPSWPYVPPKIVGIFQVYRIQQKMPKKKTGARKKAEKQKERQRGIREARDRPITEYFCNVTMVR